MPAATTGPAKSKEQKAAFAEMIASREEAVQALAEKARALIVEIMPSVVESVWARQGTASYGTGPKKMSEHFCYFSFAKTHVSFGFYYGAELDDPEGLLEGSGKRMRSVKIRDAAQLGEPAFRALVITASTHRVPPAP